MKEIQFILKSIVRFGRGLGNSKRYCPVSSPFNKIAVIRHNKPEAVLVPIDEYERIIAMSESYEYEQIAKIVDEREYNRKEPAVMVSLEEMMERLRKKGINE